MWHVTNSHRSVIITFLIGVSSNQRINYVKGLVSSCLISPKCHNSQNYHVLLIHQIVFIIKFINIYIQLGLTWSSHREYKEWEKMTLLHGNTR